MYPHCHQIHHLSPPSHLFVHKVKASGQAVIAPGTPEQKAVHCICLARLDRLQVCCAFSTLCCSKCRKSLDFLPLPPWNISLGYGPYRSACMLWTGLLNWIILATQRYSGHSRTWEPQKRKQNLWVCERLYMKSLSNLFLPLMHTTAKLSDNLASLKREKCINGDHYYIVTNWLLPITFVISLIYFESEQGDFRSEDTESIIDFAEMM